MGVGKIIATLKRRVPRWAVAKILGRSTYYTGNIFFQSRVVGTEACITVFFAHLCMFRTPQGRILKMKERESSDIAGREVEQDGGQQEGKARSSDQPLPAETGVYKEMTQTAFSQEDWTRHGLHLDLNLRTDCQNLISQNVHEWANTLKAGELDTTPF